VTSRDHKRISDIFLKACDLEPGERAAYLDEVCAGDPELRDEIESLLHHDDEDLLKTGEGAARAAFITTYHPDGTAFTTSARAWGAGDPERYGLSSTHHIQWEAVGPRTIRWRLLHFGHEVDGSLKFVSRTHGVLEFDETFERGNGTFQVDVLAPGAVLDPLDPNNPAAEPLFSAEGRNEIRRLRVSESTVHDSVD